MFFFGNRKFISWHFFESAHLLIATIKLQVMNYTIGHPNNSPEKEKKRKFQKKIKQLTGF